MSRLQSSKEAPSPRVEFSSRSSRLAHVIIRASSFGSILSACHDPSPSQPTPTLHLLPSGNVNVSSEMAAIAQSPSLYANCGKPGVWAPLGLSSHVSPATSSRGPKGRSGSRLFRLSRFQLQSLGHAASRGRHPGYLEVEGVSGCV